MWTLSHCRTDGVYLQFLKSRTYFAQFVAETINCVNLLRRRHVTVIHRAKPVPACQWYVHMLSPRLISTYCHPVLKTIIPMSTTQYCVAESEQMFQHNFILYHRDLPANNRMVLWEHSFGGEETRTQSVSYRGTILIIEVTSVKNILYGGREEGDCLTYHIWYVYTLVTGMWEYTVYTHQECHWLLHCTSALSWVFSANFDHCLALHTLFSLVSSCTSWWVLIIDV